MRMVHHGPMNTTMFDAEANPCFLSRRILGDVHRKIMQQLFVVLYGTLVGSYLRDALHEGYASDDVACLPAPRAQAWFPFLISF
jgi:hypothetical protein